jgi:dynein regulatory complex protein 1
LTCIPTQLVAIADGILVGPQGKYRHFEAADVRRYKEVWEMNEQQVAGLVRKVLQADRVLHAQQLGMAWHAPSEELFASPWCASWATLESSLGDAKSSLGDAKSSLGDAESSLGDATSSLGDAESSLGDAESSLGDAESSLGDARELAG